MSEPFSVRVTVRGYETDVQGHLNQAVYLNYAEHARWSLLQAAGIGQADLVASGVGPVAWRRPSATGGNCSPVTRSM